MLTDTQCRTAKAKIKLCRLNDFNELHLEVKPNGKKAWRYRFKLNGKSSMFALGEYPAVKLIEARQKCEQARKQVADGVSPTQARQLDKIRKVNDAYNTFELIAKEWLQMKEWAEITKTRRLIMRQPVSFYSWECAPSIHSKKPRVTNSILYKLTPLSFTARM